jgi:hypothetical protein
MFFSEDFAMRGIKQKLLLVLLVCVAAALAVVIPQPPQLTYDKTTTGTIPDLDQNRDYTGDGVPEQMWCAPTAAADCVWYYGSGSYPNLIPPGASDPCKADTMITNLGALMGTNDAAGGTTIAGAVAGLKAYYDSQYPGTFTVNVYTAWTFPDPTGAPSASNLWNWMTNNLHDCNDVLPILWLPGGQQPTPPTSNSQVIWDTPLDSITGHLVMMTAYDYTQNPDQITVYDPDDDADGAHAFPGSIPAPVPVTSGVTPVPNPVGPGTTALSTNPDGASAPWIVGAIISGAGELPKKPVPDLKWSQPPIEYDPTEPEPRFCGWDEVSFTDDPNQWWRIAADDFRCFGSMPIDSIHWWGSHWWWDGDEPPPGDPPIAAWRIGFWSNIPADPTGADPCWSRPEMLLWQIEVPAARVPVERVGIDEHPYNEGFLETCFQYYVDLEPDEVFWQEDFLADTQDDVFWLSIAAIYDPCDMVYVDYPWGWKTRPWSWMDDGVVFEINDENPQEGMVIDPINNYMYPLEWYESYDLAFELDTDPNWIKWDQAYTGIRHWPHYEDVPSWAEIWDEVPYHMVVAADDWKCQGPLPVTALAWYGSYLDYEYQPCDPCFVQPPPEQPAYFDVSIWTDVPADPCDLIMPWSHPDEPVWQYRAYNYDEVLVGYDKHPHDPCFVPVPGPREPVFRYTARIPEEEWFWQDPNEDTVYWLSIVAVYEYHYPQYEWGWTNHQHVYNDDAVQTPPMTDPDPAIPWQWYEIYDQTGASADLSFTIYTDPYACRTCADFDDNGSIDLNDLRILAVNWLWTGTPGGYNIGDLNCDGKVDNEDFAIFALQWLDSCP